MFLTIYQTEVNMNCIPQVSKILESNLLEMSQKLVNFWLGKIGRWWKRSLYLSFCLSEFCSYGEIQIKVSKVTSVSLGTLGLAFDQTLLTRPLAAGTLSTEIALKDAIYFCPQHFLYFYLSMIPSVLNYSITQTSMLLHTTIIKQVYNPRTLGMHLKAIAHFP